MFIFLIVKIGDAMGIVQHHDAVSGTERQDVANDYAQRLSDGIAVAEVSRQNFCLYKDK
jgi:alpha-mannosidase